MKSVIETIRVIKVENGYVVNVDERSFVSLDEDGVKEIINNEVPELLNVLEKKQKDETQNAIPRSGQTAETTTPTPTTEISDAG